MAKKTVKKALTKKAPVSRKPTPAAKPAAKKMPAKPPKTKPVLRKGKVAEPAPEPVKIVFKKVLKAAELREYKDLLQKLRDRIVDGISFLAGDNLNRSQRDSSGDLSGYGLHMADQGTDNFDREFALNLVSSEQDILYEVDDAIQRIQLGQYGCCEECGKAIEKPRLKALPFAKMCIGCKSQAEKGKTRFRPFGPTLSQTTATET